MGERHQLHRWPTACNWQIWNLEGVSKMTLLWQGDTLGGWFLCDKESHTIWMHTEKWPKYGIQSRVASTWADHVTLIVAIAWFCAQCVSTVVVTMPNRDILKDNSQKKRIITSFKKGRRKPSWGKVGLMAPGVRLLGQQSPIVYNLTNPTTDSASIAYHTALVKASDERIQCQILGQDWVIQSPGEVRLATHGAVRQPAGAWGRVAVLCAAGGWGSL